jgi:hypothetical protein
VLRGHGPAPDSRLGHAFRAGLASPRGRPSRADSWRPGPGHGPAPERVLPVHAAGRAPGGGHRRPRYQDIKSDIQSRFAAFTLGHHAADRPSRAETGGPSAPGQGGGGAGAPCADFKSAFPTLYLCPGLGGHRFQVRPQAEGGGAFQLRLPSAPGTPFQGHPEVKSARLGVWSRSPFPLRGLRPPSGSPPGRPSPAGRGRLGASSRRRPSATAVGPGCGALRPWATWRPSLQGTRPPSL